jgi:hypothetical protein
LLKIKLFSRALAFLPEFGFKLGKELNKRNYKQNRSRSGAFDLTIPLVPKKDATKFNVFQVRHRENSPNLEKIEDDYDAT